MKSVLVATDSKNAAQTIREALAPDYHIDLAFDGNSSVENFHLKRYDFTFLDVAFLHVQPKGRQSDYARAVEPYRRVFPTAIIVVMAPPEKVRETIGAVKAGISGYLCYPLNPVEVRHLVESLLEWQKLDSELRYLRNKDLRPENSPLEITKSPLMQDVLEKASLVAPTKTTVLLTGETGTGKSMLARLIHGRSNRANGPFISVHCGAIPENLVESELFGHEKGAFTGATHRKLGKFQIADRGTIFLDEIGTVSPGLQVKLLQVLQEGRLTRVGGEAALDVDVRVIAATNMDLRKMCRDGSFRQDLYYRLNGFLVDLPPLRLRPEDIPRLVDIFIDQANRANQRNIKACQPEVMEALQKYAWPGNIRELENLVSRACILEPGPCLTATAFPLEVISLTRGAPPEPGQAIVSLDHMRQQAMYQADLQYLNQVMALTKGRVGRAAALAGVTPRHFRNLLKKYHLCKEDFRC
jgi:DNA-binding NtrC family response regulator